MINKATGQELIYRQRNAVRDKKDVHAEYCASWPKQYYKDGVIIHPKEKNDFQFGVGMDVVALWNQDGYFYGGKITNIYERVADIFFKNGHRQQNQFYKYIVSNKRSPNQKVCLIFGLNLNLKFILWFFVIILKAGDYVLANIMNEFGQDVWVPGLIKSVNYSDIDKCKIYTVIYFNGQEGENINKQLIKIKKGQYNMFVENFMAKQAKPPKSPPKIIEPVGDFDIAKFILTSDEYRVLRDKYQPLLEPVQGTNSLVASDDCQNSALAQGTCEIEGLLERRLTMSKLTVGEQVLAKSADDCFYFPSKVVKVLGGGKYSVENNKNKQLSDQYREDIITCVQAFDCCVGNCKNVIFIVLLACL